MPEMVRAKELGCAGISLKEAIDEVEVVPGLERVTGGAAEQRAERGQDDDGAVQEPRFVGAESVVISGKSFTVGGTTVREGDVISIDGTRLSLPRCLAAI